MKIEHLECYPLAQTEDEGKHLCSRGRDCRKVAPKLRRVMSERVTIGPVRIPVATHCCLTPTPKRVGLRQWMCAECARQWCRRRKVEFPEVPHPLFTDMQDEG